MSKDWGRFEAPEGWNRDVPYDIRERAFQFGVRVIREARSLPNDVATRVTVFQLVKSATSVGANVEEADGAESRRDFVHKMSIARKEAREVRYWIRVISASIVENEEWTTLLRESEEIARILSAIIRSS